MKPNYKQIYAMKAEREKRIKKVCPDIPYTSGIYVFHRVDEAGIRRAYVGQAVSICERCASHLAEYDHIGLSLKKHGLYGDKNPYGWQLDFITCPKEELDEKEIANIKSWADAGWQLYNVSSGGQGKGKIIENAKSPKGYRDGLTQGRVNLARELRHIIEKHLLVILKPGKENNKVSQKALEKFNELISEGNKDE